MRNADIVPSMYLSDNNTIHIDFVRHGESVANEKKILCGQCNSPLTQKGHNEAKDLARKLNLHKMCWDKIFSSPLSRALDTAQYLNFDNLSITKVDELMETYTGKHSLGPKEDYVKNIDRRILLHGQIPDLKFLEGESLLDMIDRSSAWLMDNLIQEAQLGNRILVVGHMGPICGFLHRFFNIPLNNFPTFQISNASLTSLQITKNAEFGWMGKILKLSY